MTMNVFRGTIPALMTPCDGGRRPDFDALVRKAGQLIAAGMSAVVYCGSMGDLAAAQRRGADDGGRGAGRGRCSRRRRHGRAEHAPCRRPRRPCQAVRRCRADDHSTRVLSRGPSATAQRAHFEAVLDAAVDLPSVIYNGPSYGYETKADLFFALRERYPHLRRLQGIRRRHVAAVRRRAYHEQGPIAHVVGGGDTQVFHGFVNCGATSAITGIGNVLPHEVLHLVELCRKAQAGDVEARRRAAELDQALAVLSSFDEGADLVLFYKYLMTLQGNAEYRAAV